MAARRAAASAIGAWLQLHEKNLCKWSISSWKVNFQGGRCDILAAVAVPLHLGMYVWAFFVSTKTCIEPCEKLRNDA
jgi:hypothetical protein